MVFGTFAHWEGFGGCSKWRWGFVGALVVAPSSSLPLLPSSSSPLSTSPLPSLPFRVQRLQGRLPLLSRPFLRALISELVLGDPSPEVALWPPASPPVRPQTASTSRKEEGP